MPEEALLHVLRCKAHPNRIRAYKLLLDGREIGVVRNGQLFEATIPPGEHVLIAKVDWARSRPLSFQCTAGERVSIRCETSADPVAILKAGFGLPGDHLRLSLRSQENLEPDEAEQSAHKAIRKRQLLRGLAWAIGCFIVGGLTAAALEGADTPRRVTTARQELAGQLTGFIAVVGGSWIAFRRP
ncbi:MAG: hypothetical protein KDA79_08945 [Planctomycetaceae bacterium]|nr:hypothetical protein [Planctomycetaceae bacterium]